MNVRDVHTKLGHVEGRNVHERVHKVSHYVNQVTLILNKPEESLNRILSYVNEIKAGELYSSIVLSLESYLPSKKNWLRESNVDDQWYDIISLALERHIKCAAVPDIYHTLLEKPCEIAVTMEQQETVDNFVYLFGVTFMVYLFIRYLAQSM